MCFAAPTAYDYVFAENGLVALKDGKKFAEQSLVTELGEEKLRPFIDFVLRYIADLDIPVKRGTFIEFRAGMLNVSPIGRNCNQKERDDFEAYDKVRSCVRGVRQSLILRSGARRAGCDGGCAAGALCNPFFPILYWRPDLV